MPLLARVIRRELRHDGSKCLAYVSVALPEIGIEVRGVRIVRKPDGSLHAQLPQQRNHRGVWFAAVHFADPETGAAIKTAAMAAFERARVRERPASIYDMAEAWTDAGA